jgi:hypothetical protein
MAANYVSFTLIDDFMGDGVGIGKKSKQKKVHFFKHFYNAIAQSIFCCLFFAYPKSRVVLNNDEIKRQLLDIFSELFTGIQIKSASFDHWNIDIGATMMVHAKTSKKDEKQLSLADVKTSSSAGRTRRDMVHMKYSPLVERYLKAHKYETMNNVQEWKMLLTQRTGIQKEIDEKFRKYKIIAENIVQEK